MSARPPGAPSPLSPQRGPDRAYLEALRRLGRRDHSELEMASALGRKGFGEDAILPVLERLRGEGLLNDERLSERVARSRIEGRGLGRHRVRRELFLRGVEKETAEKGLVSALAEVSETGALDSAARRYWASHKSVEPQTRLRRLYVFLCRRGFPAPLVADRLHALWPRLGDVLDAEPLSADDLEGT